MDRQTDGDTTRRVWAELRSRLIAQQERSAGATLYMLVDGRAIRDIRSLLGVIPGLSYTSLWLGTIGERMMGIGPWLARLEEAFLDTEYGLHEKLAVRVLHAPEKYAITWILSTASLDVLAAHFRAYTQCKFGHRAFYLHFCDNRILENLRRIYTPEQRAHFMSPCHSMTYREFREDIFTDWCREDEQEAPPGPALVELAEDQNRFLVEASYGGRLAMWLSNEFGHLVAGRRQDDLIRFVDVQIETARGHGIREESLLRRYTLLAAHARRNLHDVDGAAAILSAVARAECPPEQGIALLRDLV